MVDPITVAIVSTATKMAFQWLTTDTRVKCAKCHHRVAQSATKCCNTPMCDVCIGGKKKKKGLFLKKDHFDCPFCRKSIALS